MRGTKVAIILFTTIVLDLSFLNSPTYAETAVECTQRLQNELLLCNSKARAAIIHGGEDHGKSACKTTYDNCPGVNGSLVDKSACKTTYDNCTRSADKAIAEAKKANEAKSNEALSLCTKNLQTNLPLCPPQHGL